MMFRKMSTREISTYLSIKNFSLSTKYKLKKRWNIVSDIFNYLKEQKLYSLDKI